MLDTNILIAAMRSPSGASARLVSAALDGRLTLVANVALFAEYEATMVRPEHLAAAGATQTEVTSVLDDLAQIIVPAVRDVSWRPQLTDPDDEMVLEAAINGGAEAIVTFEMQTFISAARAFGIAVMTPAAVWARIRQ